MTPVGIVTVGMDIGTELSLSGNQIQKSLDHSLSPFIYLLLIFFSAISYYISEIETSQFEKIPPNFHVFFTCPL